MYGHTPKLPIKLRAEVIATRRDAVEGLVVMCLVNCLQRQLAFFALIPLIVLAAAAHPPARGYARARPGPAVFPVMMAGSHAGESQSEPS